MFCFVLFLIIFYNYYWLRHVELPQPGIKLVPPAAEAQSLNHWTTREYLEIMFLTELLLCVLFPHI